MDMKKRVGDYEILDELGSGGMGRVFRVRNVISDRVEAMKVLLPDLIGREDLAARFQREIKLLAGLSHPNIAALRTALSADNQLVMIMELVEGQSLAARLTSGPIATADAVNYIDQVLDALGYAHARQIVHRDVKPANMILTPQGIVKLTDFGIARSRNDQTLTATGTTTGSLNYMSPEQVKGEATDVRSDLYSVGISLYEMVTGRRPFEATSDFGVMVAQVEARAKAPMELQPTLSPTLNDIILKAIEKDPDARFQSTDEFRSALAVVATVQSGAATRTTPALAAGPSHHATPAAASAANRAPQAPQTDAGQQPATGRAAPAAASAAASTVPGPQLRSGHPFMFVALGGVLVIIALVGTGLYLGRAAASPWRQTAIAPALTSQPPAAPAPATAPAATSGDLPTASSAGGAPPPAPAAPPASEPAPPPPASAGPPAAEPAAAAPSSPPIAPPAAVSLAAPSLMPSRARTTSPVSPPAAKPVEPPATSAGVSGPPAGGSGTVEPTAQERAQEAAALEQLDLEIDRLISRATTVNATLDRMQQQQARQGVGLRSDMAARQDQMNAHLTRARDAVGKNDAARAKKFRDAGEADLDALEKFLGR